MRGRCLLSLALLVVAATSSVADTFWKIDGSGSWLTSSNWTSGLPSASANTYIGYDYQGHTFDNPLQYTIDLTGSSSSVAGTVKNLFSKSYLSLSRATLTIAGSSVTMTGGARAQLGFFGAVKGGATLDLHGGFDLDDQSSITATSVNFGADSDLRAVAASSKITANQLKFDGIGVIGATAQMGFSNTTLNETLVGSGSIKIENGGSVFVDKVAWTGHFDLGGPASSLGIRSATTAQLDTIAQTSTGICSIGQLDNSSSTFDPQRRGGLDRPSEIVGGTYLGGTTPLLVTTRMTDVTLKGDLTISKGLELNHSFSTMGRSKFTLIRDASVGSDPSLKLIGISSLNSELLVKSTSYLNGDSAVTIANERITVDGGSLNFQSKYQLLGGLVVTSGEARLTKVAADSDVTASGPNSKLYIYDGFSTTASHPLLATGGATVYLYPSGYTGVPQTGPVVADGVGSSLVITSVRPNSMGDWRAQNGAKVRFEGNGANYLGQTMDIARFGGKGTVTFATGVISQLNIKNSSLLNPEFGSSAKFPTFKDGTVFDDGFTVTGKIDLGTHSIHGNRTINLQGGTIRGTVYDILRIDPGQSGVLEGPSGFTLAAAGQGNIAGSAHATVVRNYGGLTVEKTGSLSIDLPDTASGLLDAQGGQIRVDGQLAFRDLTQRAGILRGTGLLTGAVTIQGGSVGLSEPGESLKVAGSLTIGSGGELVATISDGGFQRLDVTGPADLSGGLRVVDLRTGFSSTPWLTVATATEGLKLNLSSFTGSQWEYRQQGSDLQIRAVPEVASFSAFGVGLIVLGFRRKRSVPPALSAGG